MTVETCVMCREKKRVQLRVKVDVLEDVTYAKVKYKAGESHGGFLCEECVNTIAPPKPFVPMSGKELSGVLKFLEGKEEG